MADGTHKGHSDSGKKQKTGTAHRAARPSCRRFSVDHWFSSRRRVRTLLASEEQSNETFEQVNHPTRVEWSTKTPPGRETKGFGLRATYLPWAAVSEETLSATRSSNASGHSVVDGNLRAQLVLRSFSNVTQRDHRHVICVTRFTVSGKLG
jgi:hypothetical protein